MSMPPPTWARDIALLLLRLCFGGLMMVNHGLGKLDKLTSGNTKFADPLGLGQELSLQLAVGAEVVCATLVALGLFTRLATIPLMFTMGIAAFVVHGADPLSKKESALLFLVAYTVLLILGPGRIALGHVLLRRKPNNRVLAWLLT